MRGEIWRADLDPARGVEASKVRPVLIVGRRMLVDAAMRVGGTVTVVPITSNVAKVFDFQVLLPAGTGGLEVDSKAQAEQIRTLSVTRLMVRLGAVPSETSSRVDDAIRLYLGL
ncbi:type II toxin-antitoxin system PemK/MazF family toxin [Demequina iriomotensis]|uniref:type II toxin-antitoxin system PemK/MazF family toxin n=1 Tax=Demequina iriomotensis TaxID=1536641 RepID=UPI0007833602|nr:type II toxin-antitoxin system PemK/MazF family toxin [Demequina iriomotensis]